MPYFNCSSRDKEGVIAAIGWSGHWRSLFKNGETGMEIKLSYPADFYLRPGESVKLPTVLLMPWRREDNGDRDLTDTFVLFRRIMRDYILPQNIKNGYITLRSWGGDSMDAHEKKLENIKRFGIPCDAYGIDAGWYELEGTPPKDGLAGNWHATVGDWRESRSIFSDGLEQLSGKAREAGSKGFWLWFEFERAVDAAAAFKAHPEHYLKLKKNDGEMMHAIVNMGEENARSYIKSILYPLIRRINLTMFRVDFNIDPREYFENADDEQRAGITELKYYDGLYTFFAEMQEEFPDMIIDNCASGGRRLDFRMCSFGVPVNCRSDYFTIEGDHATGQQAQMMGLSRWLPVHGDAAYSCMLTRPMPKDTYSDRSVYSSNYSLTAFSGQLSEEEGRMYKKIVEEAFAAREYMALDFYPLTGYSLSPRDWCAYEMCDEDASRGMVIAFRRELNNTPKQIYALCGLDKDSEYSVKDIDTERTVKLSGRQLMEGFEIEIDKPRDSKIFMINRI